MIILHKFCEFFRLKYDQFNFIHILIITMVIDQGRYIITSIFSRENPITPDEKLNI